MLTKITKFNANYYQDKAIADKAIADKLRKFPLLDLFAVDWAFHDFDQQKTEFILDNEKNAS